MEYSFKKKNCYSLCIDVSKISTFRDTISIKTNRTARTVFQSCVRKTSRSCTAKVNSRGRERAERTEPTNEYSCSVSRPSRAERKVLGAESAAAFVHKWKSHICFPEVHIHIYTDGNEIFRFTTSHMASANRVQMHTLHPSSVPAIY